ncbi:NADPH-dependent ferric siderophore reductase [Methylopila jiangsuensis]|uniref:NADPH-dependent ferric siderophore reductase n=1 Tax=Methylopila jiangsuensis TaxID=586230 RepID=A0A9W6N3P9_9HYPH|nr:siderophore-interacting protein [Methylopila jiangsuensis]MDR6286389.1 NADPH-dependent ferric siderophore reductase [Methylopila jiangsuensis]GLK77274.1 NADPH-dependent ferric siderophore reductase [Methylopila jiangsuensis]
MNRLVAEAEFELADPVAVLDPLCEHLIEHGADVRRESDAWDVTLPIGVVRLRRAGRATVARIETDSLEHLYLLKLSAASHLEEFAEGEKVDIVWRGDGADVTTPPNYRRLTVASAVEITPHMRRLTLTGPDIGRFMTDQSFHVRLVIPQADGLPTPRVGPDGKIAWPENEPKPALRVYTIRRYDRDAGTIDVDAVIHADPGPGAAWAAAAKAGDLIGMVGPGGGGMPPESDWLLFAGDETALPAIGRMLETLPADARGEALLEIEDDGERQTLTAPAEVSIRWLSRAAGAPTLAEAVRAAAIPENAASPYVWAASESAAAQSMREHLRGERGLPKDRQHVVAYWRKGRAD